MDIIIYSLKELTQLHIPVSFLFHRPVFPRRQERLWCRRTVIFETILKE